MVRTFTILCYLLLPLLAIGQTDGTEGRGAEIYSLQQWKYGKIDIRMRMAKGSGLLSTFFTYKNGSEVSGAFWEEIDIEVLGKDNAEKMQSNIISGNPKEMSEEIHMPGFSLADDYHTYTIEWTPDYVAWFIDGVEMRKTVGGQVLDLTNPQSFRMNIWSHEEELWVGPFDASSVLPAYQFVNWISYASYAPGEGDNGSDFKFDWRDDFNTFNSTRWARANWTFGGNRITFDPANVLVKDGYLILAITPNGQTGYTGTVPVDSDVTSTRGAAKKNAFRLYPNPTSSKVRIEGETVTNNWTLMNAMGEELLQGNGVDVDLERFSNGVYFLHMDGQVMKVVKN